MTRSIAAAASERRRHFNQGRVVMHKFVIAVAAAGSALALASPATAQYYPQAQSYGQPYGYNNGYGYNGFGQVQALQARIDALQNRIRFMDRRNIIRDHSADQLKAESRQIERRLHSAARHGLNSYEMGDIQRRVAQLEQRVQFATNAGYGRGYGYNNNGRGGYYADRDRDGRDDRYENDQGRDRDGRDDRYENDQGQDRDD